MQIRGLSDSETPPATSRVTSELADDLRAAVEAIQTGKALPSEQRERVAGAVSAVALALDGLAATLEPAELAEGRSA